MKVFHLYMLRCADGSYYVGHTDDLETRIAQHVSGEIPGYTSTRRPVQLVYACEFQTRDQAFERERQVKGWSRAKKEALIREDWNGIQVLARNRQTSDASAARPSTGSGRADNEHGSAWVLSGSRLTSDPRSARPSTGSGRADDEDRSGSADNEDRSAWVLSGNRLTSDPRSARPSTSSGRADNEDRSGSADNQDVSGSADPRGGCGSADDPGERRRANHG